jgi:hypothetical protein
MNETSTNAEKQRRYRHGVAHRLDAIEATTSRIEDLLVELLAERGGGIGARREA